MNRFYIQYMNKDKNFKIDKIYFENYEDALILAKSNLEKFDLDMIKYEF